MIDTEQQLTDEETQALQQYMAYGSVSDQKHTVHAFLHKVATASDTTKLGNLKEEEVGVPRHPIRTYKELALFCKDIADMPYFEDYFNNMSEIVTSTSLSKNAKLIELAVITRRQLEDVTKPKRKQNKSWFKKKDGSESGGEEQ